MKKQFLQVPFQIGNCTLPNNIFYAPLAGCSDFPFRKMSAQYSKKYRPGLIFCEMVKMDALVRNDPVTFHMLDFDKEMHPIAAQLCGSKPSLAGPCAKIIESLGFDTVDLNCGCPVDKVTKDGSGSGLLKNPSLIGEIICNMVAAVKIPVTLKIRAGWDETQIVGKELTIIAEQAGACAICIHGRTRKQGYKGPANWDYIKECKEVAKSIKIIGNGDVTDGPSAARMFEYTGCDAVLVARATLGRPWIGEEIIHHLLNEEIVEEGPKQLHQALIEHFMYTQGYHNPKRVSLDMRRVGCWYFKKSSGTRHFRDAISRASSLHEVESIISDFSLENFTVDPNEKKAEEACQDEC